MFEVWRSMSRRKPIDGGRRCEVDGKAFGSQAQLTPLAICSKCEYRSGDTELNCTAGLESLRRDREVVRRSMRGCLAQANHSPSRYAGRLKVARNSGGDFVVRSYLRRIASSYSTCPNPRINVLSNSCKMCLVYIYPHAIAFAVVQAYRVVIPRRQ
jgi:hypothetical protein